MSPKSYKIQLSTTISLVSAFHLQLFIRALDLQPSIDGTCLPTSGATPPGLPTVVFRARSLGLGSRLTFQLSGLKSQPLPNSHFPTPSSSVPPNSLTVFILKPISGLGHSVSTQSVKIPLPPTPNSRYRFRTWVTLQVQEIGNTLGLLLAE